MLAQISTGNTICVLCIDWLEISLDIGASEKGCIIKEYNREKLNRLYNALKLVLTQSPL